MSPRPAKPSAPHTRGFTLIEVLISTAILVIITSGMLVRSRSFDSSLEFTNTVYEVALLIREAQVYGTSARESDKTSQSDNFSLPFGIHVNRTAPRDRVILFQDNASATPDYNYSGEAALETFIFPEGITIYSHCAHRYNGAGLQEQCSINGGGSPSRMNILFERPNSEPIVKTSPPGSDDFVAASITLQTDTGRYRRIDITETGLIEIGDEF